MVQSYKNNLRKANTQSQLRLMKNAMQQNENYEINYFIY